MGNLSQAREGEEGRVRKERVRGGLWKRWKDREKERQRQRGKQRGEGEAEGRGRGRR